MDFLYTGLFLFCATVFFLLGWLDLLPINKPNKDWKWLKEEGTPVVANIDHIQQYGSGKKKSSSWIILASWTNPEDGKYYTFKSSKVDFDPTIFLTSGMIPALIDINNPRRYYIDLQDLRMNAGH